MNPSDSTDFGNMYSKNPSQVFSPSTIEELSKILRDLNDKNISVTIKNTGCSIKGQTLTNGVQVALGKMTWVHFDEYAKEVTVGAGTSWDSLLKAIEFPKYCTPVFPDTPGQSIHVIGMLSVGGIGAYSLSAGGIWNHVKRLTLVTMEGDVIVCSRTENPDLFRYSLGGFGRIGVIAEATLNIVPSPERVSPVTIICRNKTTLSKTLKITTHDQNLKGIFWGFGRATFGANTFLSFPAHAIVGIIEKSNYKVLHEQMKKKYGHSVLYRYPLAYHDKKRTISKRDVVYHTLRSFSHQTIKDRLYHPWSDYVIPIEHIETFCRMFQKLLYKYKLNNFGFKESITGTPVYVHFDAIGFLMKNDLNSENFSFPLSLNLSGQDMVAGVGCWLEIPPKKLTDAKAFINETTELCYSFGGKLYLYGWHELTKKQVEQQYGIDIINEWNSIKARLDPKHLLNIGVIEHLDECGIVS